jgi:pimeloyl-ACP methyl ester carboxylesterase
LKSWDIIDSLHKIKTPTLLLNSRYDEAQDSAVQPFFDKIDKAKWYTFSESSHMPHWEERDHYMEVVGHFLRAKE